MRRITWRFSAKLFFQASSSASDAKIWEAMASCSSSDQEVGRIVQMLLRKLADVRE